jgi:hypothetical protein
MASYSEPGSNKTKYDYNLTIMNTLHCDKFWAWIFAVLWWPFWKWRPVEIFRCQESIFVFKIFKMSAIFKMATKTQHKKSVVKIQHLRERSQVVLFLLYVVSPVFVPSFSFLFQQIIFVPLFHIYFNRP